VDKESKRAMPAPHRIARRIETIRLPYTPICPLLSKAAPHAIRRTFIIGESKVPPMRRMA
jgi:hypothetical protein